MGAFAAALPLRTRRPDETLRTRLTFRARGPRRSRRAVAARLALQARRAGRDRCRSGLQSLAGCGRALLPAKSDHDLPLLLFRLDRHDAGGGMIHDAKGEPSVRLRPRLVLLVERDRRLTRPAQPAKNTQFATGDHGLVDNDIGQGRGAAGEDDSSGKQVLQHRAHPASETKKRHPSKAAGQFTLKDITDAIIRAPYGYAISSMHAFRLHGLDADLLGEPRLEGGELRRRLDRVVARMRQVDRDVGLDAAGPRADITTTRVAMKIASSMSWVTNSTVLRSRSQMPSSSSCISARVWLSSAPNGSSSSRIFGSLASARAIAVRCCMPPESCFG